MRVDHMLDPNLLEKTPDALSQVPASADKMEKVAGEFESMFLKTMLKEMRKTAAPADQSNALGIYQDMLDSEYAKLSSSHQSLGLKEMILQWMREASTGEAKTPKDPALPR